MREVNGIFCSDLHLRLDQPEARLDNFVEAQERKYEFLRNLQKKHDCPVLVSGDIFHYWKTSPELLSFALRVLPDNLIAIPGQHDLPAHSLENIHKSGIQVLAEAGKIRLLTQPDVEPLEQKMKCDIGVTGFPWNVEFGEISPLYSINIALIHYLVYKGEEPFPEAAQVGGTGKAVLKKMKGYDCVVSGDNHISFTETLGNQILINPGSFMRSRADQIDHKPSVFLWCAESNEVERVYLPAEQGVISRTHIDKVKQREERKTAFVERLDNVSEISLSFIDNLNGYIKKNKVSKEVQSIIAECMEEVK